MPLNYDIQPARLGQAFQQGQQQYHNLQAAREQTSMAPIRKRLAELGVQRQEQAVRGTELDFQNQSVRKYIGDAYQLSQIADPQERTQAATALAQSYLQNNDPYDDEAGNNLMQIVQQGPEALDQVIGAVVQRGAAEGVIQLPQDARTQQTKPWTNPDIAVNPETERPEYFITNQATGETKWLGKSPEAKPDEVDEAVRRARALADVEVETAKRLAGTEGTPEYERVQKSKDVAVKTQQEAREFRYELNNRREEARALMEQVSSGSLGFDGFIKGFIPGSAAMTDRGRIQELKSHIALERMQSMKRLSPTGATGFGQLSEKELAALEDSIARLDPNMGDDVFREQLKKVFDHYDRAIRLMDFEYMEPPRLEKGKDYTAEEKSIAAKEFAQMAIDSGFTPDEVVEMLKQERML